MWRMRSTFLSLLIVLQFSCEAPRNNPLDPQNPNYNYRRLRGTVKTVSLPVESIQEAEVYWSYGSKVTITDQQGNFAFLLPDPKNDWLYFFHPDFHSDSLFINWPAAKELYIEAHLNALPRMDSLFVYSVVLNRFPSYQKEYLIIETYINDRDNDIDSVFAIINNDTEIYHLPYNTTEKSFQREFTILDIGVLSIQELVGQPVKIGVRDIFSHYLIVGEDQLVRVIQEEVLAIAPQNNVPTSSSPTLEWQALITGYTFHYDLEIYTNEVAPEMVWQKSNLSKEQTTFTVDSQLPVGNYFWVIWAIDNFGNRSRSKPATFIVQPNE